MESRGRTLNREDFHTEEQFQAYKASKEAAPKAAFQFGVKVRCVPMHVLHAVEFSQGSPSVCCRQV